MTELIDKSQIGHMQLILVAWREAMENSIKDNTPESQQRATGLSIILAGYARLLYNTLQEISFKSDVGYLFEGCDELNDETHEANEQALLGAMDVINQIARGVFDEG